MSDALPGNSAVLSVSASDASYVAVGGVDDATISKMRAQLESTSFGDTAKNSVAGLKETTFPFSGFFMAADASQILIRASEESGAAIWVKLLVDGTNGWKCQCRIFKYDMKPGVAGRVDFSGEFTGIAAPTIQP